MGILDYLHHLDPPIIHRDIKPANLLLSPEQKVFLLDFGSIKENMTSEETQVGTFGYMAPEQLSGKAIPQSDLYSLGVSLLVLLSQQAPQHLPQKDLRFELSAFEGLSPLFKAWLEEMIEPQTSLRFASAQEALEALKRLEALLPRTKHVHLPAHSKIQIDKEGRNLEIKIRPQFPVFHLLKALFSHLFKRLLPIFLISLLRECTINGVNLWRS